MHEIDLQNRIKNALIIVAENNPYKVGDLVFSSKNEMHFNISGSTIKNSIENLNHETAIKELEEIKVLFLKMVNLSSDLQSFIKNKKIEYSLIYDYGMGSLDVCSEIDGKLEWHMELNR
jgi:hypothetical protein